MSTAINLSDLTFSYPDSAQILSIPSLSIKTGESVFVYGPSGCGKSTLLGLLSGMLPSRSGQVTVAGQSLHTFSDQARNAFRATRIGYIFQRFNLVPYLTVLENILLPTLFGRTTSSGYESSEKEALALAHSLGIAELTSRSTQSLSVGQQQRVAACRALLGSPSIILADEPTSSLDAESREAFIEVLFQQAKKEKSTVLFVSHDRSLAKRFDREISLPDINRAAKGSTI
jgi:putative ABC transport system ATP-binding protein